MKRSQFLSHQASSFVLSFDCSFKFILRHPGNHPGDRADGEYAQSRQSTRVFEYLSELGEKRVQKPFNQVGYSGPFLDQPAVGIVGGTQFSINTLWQFTLGKLTGT